MPAELWTLEGDGNWRTEYGTPYNTRDNLVYGTYRPDATTTGILSERADLTVVVGDYQTTSSNELHEGKWFKGKITVKHPGCVFRNCLITGDTAGPASPSYSAITNYDRLTTKTIIEDCTIEASVLSVYSGNGIHGKDYELYRCDISGWVDGIGMYDRNVIAKGNWVHDLRFWAWDPSHSDGSHNDGIQVHGGDSFTIVGNSLEGGYKINSCIMVTQDIAPTSNLTIDKNWLISEYSPTASATACGLNVSNTGSGGGGAAMTGVTITNNFFSPYTSFSANWSALVDASTRTAATISHNYNLGTTTLAKGLHYGV